MRKRLSVHGFARLLASAALLVTAACDESALALTERGSAVTDYDLSAIDHLPHSISMRVMLQYPNSFHNVLLGDDATSAFRLEKEETRSGAMEPPRLRVTYGGQSRLYHHTASLWDYAYGLAGSQWYDLAITVDSSNELRLYIDGHQAVAVSGGRFFLPAGTWASGNLTLGEGTPNGARRQAYGLIDDVRVWERTLTPAEVESLAEGALPSGAVRNWEFDSPEGTPTRMGNAAVVVLADDEDWVDRLPTPQHAALRLPLTGELRVSQGVDSPPGDSHRGNASFALDLVSNGGVTDGMNVLAAAPGRVAFIRQTSPDDEPNQELDPDDCTPCTAADTPASGVRTTCDYLPNVVVIDHGNDLFTEYVHLQPDSVPVMVGTMVETGTVIGRVGRSGTTNYHLHFAAAAQVNLPPPQSPGVDTGAADCGYYPAVPGYGIVTRAFVFETHRRRTGDHWDIMIEETPTLGEIIRQ